MLVGKVNWGSAPTLRPPCRVTTTEMRASSETVARENEPPGNVPAGRHAVTRFGVSKLQSVMAPPNVSTGTYGYSFARAISTGVAGFPFALKEYVTGDAAGFAELSTLKFVKPPVSKAVT